VIYKLFDSLFSILFKTKRLAVQQQQQTAWKLAQSAISLSSRSPNILQIISSMDLFIYTRIRGTYISKYLWERNVWHASVRRCPNICLTFGYKIQDTRYNIQDTNSDSNSKFGSKLAASLQKKKIIQAESSMIIWLAFGKRAETSSPC